MLGTTVEDFTRDATRFFHYYNLEEFSYEGELWYTMLRNKKIMTEVLKELELL